MKTILVIGSNMSIIHKMIALLSPIADRIKINEIIIKDCRYIFRRPAEIETIQGLNLDAVFLDEKLEFNNDFNREKFMGIIHMSLANKNGKLITI